LNEKQEASLANLGPTTPFPVQPPTAPGGPSIAGNFPKSSWLNPVTVGVAGVGVGFALAKLSDKGSEKPKDKQTQGVRSVPLNPNPEGRRTP
jgi:hypothetical protein